jgi:2-amino-4-hydroxy-6-hydroxymethyldihydropteridine diphosphokinase
MERILFMNKAYLLTGGNMGDRTGKLLEAKKNIATYCGTILMESSLYETAAWGKADQPDFLNQVLYLQTSLSAVALMKEILLIEEIMGRTRTEKYGSRTIDIDILFYNDEIIREPGLIIPHPEIQNRRFVLVPLQEIAPGLVHPVLLKSISTLLKDCGDKLDVKKI